MLCLWIINFIVHTEIDMLVFELVSGIIVATGVMLGEQSQFLRS